MHAWETRLLMFVTLYSFFTCNVYFCMEWRSEGRSGTAAWVLATFLHDMMIMMARQPSIHGSHRAQWLSNNEQWYGLDITLCVCLERDVFLSALAALSTCADFLDVLHQWKCSEVAFSTLCALLLINRRSCHAMIPEEQIQSTSLAETANKQLPCQVG